MGKLNIAFISSQGGHSGQMKIIFTREVIGKNNAVFITESQNPKAPEFNSFQKKYKTYYFRKDYLLVPNPIRYIKYFFQIRNLLKKENINLIVTNGAQISIPSVIAAKSLGIKTIFIDTFIRVKTPNWSARFCYFFSDIFLVQHESMREKYGKKSIFKGSVL